MSIQRVAVLITCFNRRETTLASLTRLFRQRGIEGVQLIVFLVDDGSTDGTSDAVRSRFPLVRILAGNGSLYWNGGARMAFGAALAEKFDAYILFNDDTILDGDALARVIECAENKVAAGQAAIVTGSTRSPLTGELTYGGFTKRTHGLSLNLEKVIPDPVECKSCDTMNGNFALIPAAVADSIGNIEGRYTHLFGDVDYGLRAKCAGFQVVVAPGFIGECSQNSINGTWRDPTVPFKKRWKNLMSPKGVPVRDWLLFTRRHYGWRWIHYAASPYVKTIMSSLFGSRSAR